MNLSKIWALIAPEVPGGQVDAFINQSWNIPPESVLAAIVLYGGGVGATITHNTNGYHVLSQEACFRCNTIVRPEGGHLCGACGRDI